MRPIQVTVPLDDQDRGIIATLHLEPIPNGIGTIFSDPIRMSFLRYDHQFATAIEQVAHLLPLPAQVDVRWWLEPWDEDDHGQPSLPVVLSGPSLAVAFYLGLQRSLDQTLAPLNRWIAVTGDLNTAGKIVAVGGFQAKLAAVRRHHITIIAPYLKLEGSRDTASLRALKEGIENQIAQPYTALTEAAEHASKPVSVGWFRQRIEELLLDLCRQRHLDRDQGMSQLIVALRSSDNSSTNVEILSEDLRRVIVGEKHVAEQETIDVLTSGLHKEGVFSQAASFLWRKELHDARNSTLSTLAALSFEEDVGGRMPIELPCTLKGRYELKEPLGEGASAVVYTALDLNLRRSVAVKILNERFANNAKFVERFEREAHATAQFNNPHVVHIYDHGQDGDKLFIVMEYVQGGTLQERIQNQTRLTAKDALPIFLDTLTGLGASHEKGIVHRDVKPANILIDQSGKAKVSDFGIAKAAAETGLTNIGEPLGTAKYMAPEQVIGEKVSPATDIYAVGVSLFEALVGRPPFDYDNPAFVMHQHTFKPPPHPSELNPEIPSEVEEVILCALEKDPAKRFSSAMEMANALRALSERPTQLLQAFSEHDGQPTDTGTKHQPEEIPAPPPRSRNRSSRPRRQKQTRLGIVPGSALFGLVVLVASALVFFVHNGLIPSVAPTQTPALIAAVPSPSPTPTPPLGTPSGESAQASCPSAEDIQQLVRVKVQSFGEACGWHWEERGASVNAICPTGFMCTINEATEIAVIAGSDQHITMVDNGTFRFIAAYSSSDVVRTPCQLLAKEKSIAPQYEPGVPVVAVNFTCTQP